ncbi:MAG: preprotein translocase subunit YajC [Bacteroidales bacterium]|nr:preprotein translocase subunit YajC [Bacteroidales bacterium]
MTTMTMAAHAAGQSSGMPMLLMMVAIFAIMWFFMIRPQQKRQKEIQKFQNALEQGMKVVLGGGIHGEVKRVNLAEGTVDVEISRGVTVTVDKANVFANGAAQATGANA